LSYVLLELENIFASFIEEIILKFMSKETCFHCGNDCEGNPVVHNHIFFCCNGCKTVYQLLTENDMQCYYDLENAPGAIPNEVKDKYNYLDNEEIIEKLLDFKDDNYNIVTFYIPHIHCSSCIWVLENLHKLCGGVKKSHVNFPKKTVKISFNPKDISLKNIVKTLSSIGYEPYISLDSLDAKEKYVDRSLIYKLGIAGFAFGNVMFLSFPEYFEITEFWLEEFKYVFRYMMLLFSIPVVAYSANGFFISAFKGLKNKILNIDVPIALGISVLFVRSTLEVLLDLGTGFFDSLTGLVFFLLLGKFFQHKTYSFLSFERDYKSYFPIAITRINNGEEENIEIFKISKGDRLLIRNQELIPVDGVLITDSTQIDYSFVTGESDWVTKKSGDKIFAGGKQMGSPIEMEALTSVKQSYLTQLWSNNSFSKKEELFKNITDNISKHFTIVVLLIALISTSYWLFNDASKALNVFTAVLIIACPCAIALAAPFTLGNFLRILGYNNVYLKNSHVIEKLAEIDTIIFDKTGTLTTNVNASISYEGVDLTQEERVAVKSIFRASNHPLSRKLSSSLKEDGTDLKLDMFDELIGKGILAEIKGVQYKIGSSLYVKEEEESSLKTTVHVKIGNIYKGAFQISNTYREGLKRFFDQLKGNYNIHILSGDNESEKMNLQTLLPNNKSIHFNQTPQDKLDFVAHLQDNNHKVMMVGDGLNDSGAFSQSNIGMAVSEDINVFSPACDAIIDATKVTKISTVLKLSKKAIKVIKLAFVLSFFYNVIGLYFAVTGQLLPVVAAILMPLSSISIVVFTTVATNLISRNRL